MRVGDPVRVAVAGGAGEFEALAGAGELEALAGGAGVLDALEPGERDALAGAGELEALAGAGEFDAEAGAGEADEPGDGDAEMVGLFEGVTCQPIT